jgi:hypothetical protein
MNRDRYVQERRSYDFFFLLTSAAGTIVFTPSKFAPSA